MKAASEQNKSREPPHSAPATDISDNPTFSHIKLEGTNAGSAMTLHRGSKGDCGCHSINIYINNNIQGANNSVLSGSEVRMRSPGVRVSFGEVGLGCRRFGSGEKMEGMRKQGDRCGPSWRIALGCVSLFLVPLLLGLFSGPKEDR